MLSPSSCWSYPQQSCQTQESSLCHHALYDLALRSWFCCSLACGVSQCRFGGGWHPPAVLCRTPSPTASQELHMDPSCTSLLALCPWLALNSGAAWLFLSGQESSGDALLAQRSPWGPATSSCGNGADVLQGWRFQQIQETVKPCD